MEVNMSIDDESDDVGLSEYDSLSESEEEFSELSESDVEYSKQDNMKKISEDEDEDKDDEFIGTYTKKIKSSPLYIACKEGKIEQVQHILSTFPPGYIDLCPPRTGRSPMAIACAKGFAEIVKLLLHHGSKVKPLKKAIVGGYPGVVELILESGANVHGVDTKGYTPLHVAAEFGNVEIAKILLLHGANPNASAATGANCVLPIHLAASAGHTQMVKLLLSEGVDIDAGTKRNETPLFLAAQNGKEDVVQLLLSKGADFNASMQFPHNSPFSIAVNSGHTGVVQILYENDATSLFPGRKYQLIYNACKHNLDLVKVLADHGISETIGTKHFVAAAEKGKSDIIQWLWDCKARNGYKELTFDKKIELVHILNRACSGGHLDTAKLLVQKGAELNYINFRESILAHACKAKKENVELVQFLLENGASTHYKKNAMQDSLITAIKHRHKETAQLLLRHGAQVSIQHLIHVCRNDDVEMLCVIYKAMDNKYVERAMQEAVKLRKVNVLRYLLEHEALKTETSTNFLCQLARKADIRHTEKCVEIAKLLLKSGADVNGTFADTSILACAVEKGNSELVWLFTIHGADTNFQIGGKSLLDFCGRNKKLRTAVLHFWSPATHRYHPDMVKQALKCLLLVAKRQNWNFGKEIMHNICAYVAFGWTPAAPPKQAREEPTQEIKTSGKLKRKKLKIN